MKTANRHGPVASGVYQVPFSLTNLDGARIVDLEWVTGWFHPYVKPEYVGEYEICHQLHIFPIGRGRWNGVIWTSVDTGLPLKIQVWHWRGLAKEPT